MYPIVFYNIVLYNNYRVDCACDLYKKYLRHEGAALVFDNKLSSFFCVWGRLFEGRLA
jgi:hypothetical protein